ncbi:MAG: DNA repair protein RecO [bacterium]|nr:DNA repair protein RecO [bacterium]
MAVHYRTQAFILNKTDWNEADQIFTVYTEEFGKIKIAAKAIRKIKSKLRSGMDLFYLSEIEFIQGKTYKTLTDALVIDKFENIRENLEKLEVVSQIAEALDSLVHEQEQDENIWNLLNEAFDKLKNSWDNHNLIYRYFLWNLFSLLGYQLDLYHCIVCQKKLFPVKLYFNPEGIVCSDCSDRAEQKIEISPEIVKILRIILKKEWNVLSRLKISQNQEELLEKISTAHLLFYKNHNVL